MNTINTGNLEAVDSKGVITSFVSRTFLLNNRCNPSEERKLE